MSMQDCNVLWGCLDVHLESVKWPSLMIKLLQRGQPDCVPFQRESNRMM